MYRKLQFRHRLYNVYPSIREITTHSHYHYQLFVYLNELYSFKNRKACKVCRIQVDRPLLDGKMQPSENCNQVFSGLPAPLPCTCLLSCHVSVWTVCIVCGPLFAVIRNSSTTNASARTNTSARTSIGRREEMSQALPASLWVFWILSDISSVCSSIALLNLSDTLNNLIFSCCLKSSRHLFPLFQRTSMRWIRIIQTCVVQCLSHFTALYVNSHPPPNGKKRFDELPAAVG